MMIQCLALRVFYYSFKGFKTKTNRKMVLKFYFLEREEKKNISHIYFVFIFFLRIFYFGIFTQ